MLFSPLRLRRCYAAKSITYGPDSSRQPGVPVGKVTKYTWTNSTIYPGTTHDYWVYVPAQYDPSKPAAVMIFQDGAGYVNETGHSRIPIVFDNLIHKGEMPVTIGILISPGILPGSERHEQARFYRSYEYDAVTGRYARFLIEEILPEVGKSYNLTNDPNLRGDLRFFFRGQLLVHCRLGASGLFSARGELHRGIHASAGRADSPLPGTQVRRKAAADFSTGRDRRRQYSKQSGYDRRSRYGGVRCQARSGQRGPQHEARRAAAARCVALGVARLDETDREAPEVVCVPILDTIYGLGVGQPRTQIHGRSGGRSGRQCVLLGHSE